MPLIFFVHCWEAVHSGSSMLLHSCFYCVPLRLVCSLAVIFRWVRLAVEHRNIGSIPAAFRWRRNGRHLCYCTVQCLLKKEVVAIYPEPSLQRLFPSPPFLPSQGTWGVYFEEEEVLVVYFEKNFFFLFSTHSIYTLQTSHFGSLQPLHILSSCLVPSGGGGSEKIFIINTFS